MKPLNLSANALAQRLGVASARQRDCQRAAWYYGRHGTAVGAVLSHHAGILDESSAVIRIGNCTSSNWHDSGTPGGSTRLGRLV